MFYVVNVVYVIGRQAKEALQLTDGQQLPTSDCSRVAKTEVVENKKWKGSARFYNTL